MTSLGDVPGQAWNVDSLSSWHVGLLGHLKDVFWGAKISAKTFLDRQKREIALIINEFGRPDPTFPTFSLLSSLDISSRLC